MDKLELDARVARLERRINGFTAVAALVGVALGFVLFLAVVRHAHAAIVAQEPPLETSVATPLPAPTPVFISTTPQAAEGSMAALHGQLTAFNDLHNQGVISDEEWESKKARLLSGPLTPSDIRSDLELGKPLADSQAICEGERDALRAKLLGIEE